ncbi:hypothetical protein CDL15_Pgr011834 [Punica granatum]|uniref:Uncharacterized protein n=1 Tax=Punica granatum TaxID=22663 RepID=A0A218WAY2_PUNGR|nr:hypothetical protein CDL15_Pgr025508 [Punica granatum]OWM83152.1 hypothetical protein CDL15_Pgr011834 [Punica granatum]
MAQPDTQTVQRSWSVRTPCEKLICPCIKVSITTTFVFLFALFVILPNMMIPDVRIDPASSPYSFNVTSSRVDSNWNILISIKNPNKHFLVKYTNIKAAMYYSNELLSRVSIHPFIQETNNRTILRALFNLTLPRANSWAVRCLESDYARGETSINVNLQAGRRFGVGSLNWWIRGLDIYFSCTDLIFPFPSHGEAKIWVIDDAWNNCEMGLFGYV